MRTNVTPASVSGDRGHRRAGCHSDRAAVWGRIQELGPNPASARVWPSDLILLSLDFLFHRASVYPPISKVGVNVPALHNLLLCSEDQARSV